MDTIQAIIMGFVQGLSEFLPISSSAHIVLTSAIYKIIVGQSLVAGVEDEEIFFDILIHFSTLCAIFIFFRNEIIEILRDFFVGLFNKDKRNDNFKMALFIIVATFITGVMGLLIKDFAHELTENPIIVSMLLIVTGCVLYFSERFKKGEKNLDLKTSIMVGVAQGFAVFPGLSRSGLTIATAVFNGIDRVKAAKFSFLMSAPIILLASALYPLLELDMDEISSFNIKAMLVGALTAFIVGYICIKYFMKFLSKSNLKGFAYYCWVVGISMTILFALSGHL